MDFLVKSVDFAQQSHACAFYLFILRHIHRVFAMITLAGHASLIWRFTRGRTHAVIILAMMAGAPIFDAIHPRHERASFRAANYSAARRRALRGLDDAGLPFGKRFFAAFTAQCQPRELRHAGEQITDVARRVSARTRRRDICARAYASHDKAARRFNRLRFVYARTPRCLRRE